MFDWGNEKDLTNMVFEAKILTDRQTDRQTDR